MTLGLLTIGQAPRPDGLARDVQSVLGGTRVIERGALDGLGEDDIAKMAPSLSDYRLITLMSDGTSVELGKQHILPFMQRQIKVLENEGADAILLMCTGEFSGFRASVPLIAPQEPLYSVVKSLAQGGRVGSLIPLPTQIEQAKKKWSDYGASDSFVVAADPYGDEAVAKVKEAASSARTAGVAALLLDCFGYGLKMRNAARENFGGPVILARSMAARLATALVSELTG